MQSLLDDNIKFVEKNNQKLPEAYKIKLGQKIRDHELLVNDYYNAIKKCNNQPHITEIHLHIPKSDELPKLIDEFDVPKKINDDILIQQGGHDDSLDDSLNMDFDNITDEDDEPKKLIKKANTNKSKPIKKLNKKSETIEQRLERKFNAMHAEQARSIGKSLNIKPEKGKKTLSKKHVMNRVLGNSKLHTKALAELKKRKMLKTESE